MQERHFKRDKYFEEQGITTERYVIPFIEQFQKLDESCTVLEIGCGEGGNLRPFLDKHCMVTGIDILQQKISNAGKFFQDHPHRNKLNLIAADIYDPPAEMPKQYDIIFMRDVLEHIHDQERFMHYVKRFLKPEGYFFLGFPPWQNPFGGHQQMCHSSILSKLPWFHLLPGRLYPGLMRLMKEPESRIADLMEIKETRIHIERFERILRKESYCVNRRLFWFINPNYEVKFNLRPRKMPRWISSIPYLRNFLITTCYYVIQKGEGRRGKGEGCRGQRRWL